MEGWYRQADRDRDVLMRIVGLLVSLAGLADRAAGLSGRRRRYVLDVLCYSEAVAYAFLTGLMPAPPAQFEEPEPEPNPDAARLAATFRMLALVLYAMLQWRGALPGAASPRAGRCTTAQRVIGWLPALGQDTS